jgi:hypothetical protein
VLIGLVQNKKTAEEFVSDFKKYDTDNDRTYGFSEDELKEVAKDAITFNKVMSNYLMKYGFTIYDTSTEREQVLNQIVEDIKLRLG